MKRFSRHRQSLIFLLVVAALASILPGKTASAETDQGCIGKYEVKTGDTLNKIAEENHIRTDDLAELNAILPPFFTIYVGQKICIPVKSKGANRLPKWGDQPAADFTVKLEKDRFSIETSNFPKNNAYLVKVAGINPVANRDYLKVATLHTAKGGALSATYPLPKSLKNTSRVWVCLKNTLTDANVCRMDFR
jgi:LysM repeat protein